MRSDDKPTPEFQDLASFRVPPGFRGRPGAYLLLWQLAQATLFGLSPQPFYGWRRTLLRIFGAKIGKGVVVRPSARITYPWKVEIGPYSWIGDRVELYSLDRIVIGAHVVVSQQAYLCTASHDHRKLPFSYLVAPIVIEDQAWVAAGVFVAPGVTIGRGALVGARSLVLRDVPEGRIAYGSPARVQGPRRPSNARVGI